MTINLSSLTDLQILSLISEATAELTARAGKPIVERIKAEEREVVVMREPDEDQKDFVLMIKAKLRRGDYIKSGDRYDVVAITSQFPEWARLQQMPTETGAGAWSRIGERMMAPRAKEM